MTPPASAAAARTAPAAPRGQAVHGTARRPARSALGPAAVRHPRRVSGPGRSAALAGGAVALPAPGLPRRARPQSSPGIALRVLRALDGACSSALVDRLIRGRVWIGVLAFLLIGLVAMQLVVLKLNNQIGHTLAHEVALQRQNAQLGVEGSETSSGNLVEPQAAAAGMTFPLPGSIHFLTADEAALHRATSALSAPIQPVYSVEGTAPPATGASGEATTPATVSPSGEATTSATPASGEATTTAAGQATPGG